jgi:hypothetical protein
MSQSPAPPVKLDAPAWVALAGAAATFLLAGLLVVNRLFLGIKYQWLWGARPEPLVPTVPLLCGALAVAGLVVLVMFTSRWLTATPGHALLVPACAMAASALLGAGALTTLPGGGLFLAEAALNDVTFGYPSEAAGIDSPRQYLRDFPQVIARPGLRMRVRTHPPGTTLFFYAVRSVLAANPGLTARLLRRFEAPGFPRKLALSAAQEHTRTPIGFADLAGAWLGSWLLMAAVPLGVIPLFFLTREVAGTRAAVAACVLYPAIPSLTAFRPGMDQTIALLTLAAVALQVAAVARGRWWLSVLAGLAWAAAVLFTFGAIPLGFLFVGLCLLPRASEACDPASTPGAKPTLGQFLPAAWCLVGFLGAYAFLAAATGYNLVAALRAGMAFHEQLITHYWPRPYLPWLGLNLWDLVVFTGPGVVLGAAVAWRWNRGSRTSLFALVLAVTLAAVDLSGKTRGEAGRIWTLFMPLLLVAGAALVGELVRPQGWPLALLVLAQLQLTLAIMTRVETVGAIPIRWQVPPPGMSALSPARSPGLAPDQWRRPDPGGRAIPRIAAGGLPRAPRTAAAGPSLASHALPSPAAACPRERRSRGSCPWSPPGRRWVSTPRGSAGGGWSRTARSCTGAA